MPIVHPNAATTLARDPRERPAASVYRTPVPGEIMTINEVTRNSTLRANAPIGNLADTRMSLLGAAGKVLGLCPELTLFLIQPNRRFVCFVAHERNPVLAVHPEGRELSVLKNPIRKPSIDLVTARPAR
jgi:hypothetical protein